YIVGCDGAHSSVRHQLGLGFEGGRFEEEYMLADAEVQWSLPTGFVIRAMHVTDDKTDDVLVCVPLPGPGRYRMSAFVPPELAGRSARRWLAVRSGTRGRDSTPTPTTPQRSWRERRSCSSDIPTVRSSARMARSAKAHLPAPEPPTPADWFGAGGTLRCGCSS